MRGREGGEKTLLRAAFRGRERGGKKMAAREKEGRVVKKNKMDDSKGERGRD